ncbi:MAG TPA: hypothetical protein P5136_00360 [Methanofastidiosum sp.]|nr:hypothetical protein [Methanofastidiosum sp.]
MGNVNLTPEQLSKLGAHLEQKDAQGGFDGVTPMDGFIDHQVAPVQTQPKVEQVSDIKKRIAELEKDYFAGSGMPLAPTVASSSYRDELGNETYYVKNISNGIVALSDLEIVIKQGQVCDLLHSADIEDLSRSKELKRTLQGTVETPAWLTRLTQREYLEELEKAAVMRKKIETVKRQDSIRQMQTQQPANSPFQNPAVPQDVPRTRPMILAKLEKLRLAFDPDPEISKFGIAPVEFIQWIMAEALSEEELNEILGNPVVQKNHDIKAAIVEKMTIM